MPAPKKRRNPRLLSHSRPTVRKKPNSLSSQATRTLIRSYHNVQKRLHTALKAKDFGAVASLQGQISASGGLSKYQEASIQGQSRERGGDSSRILIEWLHDDFFTPKQKVTWTDSRRRKLRMLEVGALSVDSTCSRSGMFDMTRIDLNPQHPKIEMQDLMQRPLPSASELNSTGFDIVSLSLVINYVVDPVARGEMLRRVSKLLRPSQAVCEDDHEAMSFRKLLPGLFMVLPAPCVTNSRYLNEEILQEIMKSLGYIKVKSKISSKLAYYLWKYETPYVGSNGKQFSKSEVRSGRSRNNFTILLQ
ncbi:MAG: hypothetical protein LQ342_005295 [Letrouitia transgressa]|nr:MAG: hypothetical protein LQ342_005295 [Letrouitia transgressa]